MNKSVTFSSNHFYSIIEHLFISDQIASFDENIIKRNNIQYLINCTKNTPFLFSDTINIHLHFLNSTQKYDSSKILSKIDKTIEYIHKSIKNSQSILIYCENGFKKSLVILFCYLCKYLNHSNKSYYAIPSINQIILFINTKLNYDVFNECSELNLCKLYINHLLQSHWQSTNSISNKIYPIEKRIEVPKNKKITIQNVFTLNSKKLNKH